MNAEERRRFFRIDDTVGVSYIRLSAEEANAFAQQAKEHGSQFDYAANFDNRIQTLLDACRIESPIAAELIDLVNKKMNFIIHQMDIDAELIHKISYDLKQVNVSACGMAFQNNEKLERGQLLQLDITLQPSELHLIALAEVIECEKIQHASEESAYFVRLDFVEINHNDQELLIQHIVKRQSAMLKHRRQQMSE